MEKNWEEISENLALEVKREIIENYLSEKLFLEEKWKDYEDLLDTLRDAQKEVFDNSWRIYLLLNKEEVLVKDFENCTSFPLLESCERSLKSNKDVYDVSEKELRKKLFNNIVSPFAFTLKGKFAKLICNVYKFLERSLNNKYIKKYKKVEKAYTLLKEETDKFHKAFDLSYILNFFEKLEMPKEEIGAIEDREKVIEELVEKLKIPIPEPPECIFINYSPIPPLSKVSSKLSKLAKISFEKNPKNAKEILSLLL